MWDQRWGQIPQTPLYPPMLKTTMNISKTLVDLAIGVHAFSLRLGGVINSGAQRVNLICTYQETGKPS